MIRKVTIQNFEAHENTELEFGPGMNLICGLSNSGKSSILRAIRMVVNNDWDKEMVRTGCEFCRVRVETDRGWVEAERGEKVNRWRCRENGSDEQFFRNVGIHVPDLATRILGMCERDRGNGIKELPNFQTQLERHYMLSEIGEKKATSNMIAVMMDNAIGLGGIEGLIKDFSTDLLSDRKWLNENQSEINEVRGAIIDDIRFRECEELVGRIGRLQGECRKVEEALGLAEKAMGDFDAARERSDRIAGRIAMMPKAGALEDACSDLGGKMKFLAELERGAMLEQSLGRVSGVLTLDAESLSGKARLCSGKLSLLSEASAAARIAGRLGKASAIAAAVDSEALAGLAERCRSMLERIRSAQSALDESRSIWRRMTLSSNDASTALRDEQSAQKELERLKDELGVCPLCGASLKEER